MQNEKHLAAKISSTIDDFVHHVRSSLLKASCDMTVCIKCDRDGRVTKHLRHNFRMDSTFKEQGCCGMAQVVDPDSRQGRFAQDPLEGMSDIHVIPESPVVIGEHEPAVRPCISEQQGLLVLLLLVRGQGSKRAVRELNQTPGVHCLYL